jgi:MFS transporter, DHA2 family, multidrug resistance protein
MGVMGLIIKFAIGMVLLASSALLTPWLQQLGNYPVNTAGLLLAPRGIGTMLAMMVVGRITNRVDPRLLMGLGVLMLWWSMTRLSDWTPAVDQWTLIINTIVQGAGLGLVFVPLNVVAFGTLPAQLRYEGTALISLLRNIGSAIGISVFEALVTTNTEVEHSVLAPFASPLNRALHTAPWPSPATPHGAAFLDRAINYQAQVIAYNDDYWLMGLLALPQLLLLPFMTRPRRDGGGGQGATID